MPVFCLRKLLGREFASGKVADLRIGCVPDCRTNRKPRVRFSPVPRHALAGRLHHTDVALILHEPRPVGKPEIRRRLVCITTGLSNWLKVTATLYRPASPVHVVKAVHFGLLMDNHYFHRAILRLLHRVTGHLLTGYWLLGYCGQIIRRCANRLTIQRFVLRWQQGEDGREAAGFVALKQ